MNYNNTKINKIREIVRKHTTVTYSAILSASEYTDIIDLRDYKNVRLWGSALGTVDIEFSNDKINWIFIKTTVGTIFNEYIECSPNYIRIKSNSAGAIKLFAELYS
jgi:hypothetical protein